MGLGALKQKRVANQENLRLSQRPAGKITVHDAG